MGTAAPHKSPLPSLRTHQNHAVDSSHNTKWLPLITDTVVMTKANSFTQRAPCYTPAHWARFECTKRGRLWLGRLSDGVYWYEARTQLKYGRATDRAWGVLTFFPPSSWRKLSFTTKWKFSNREPTTPRYTTKCDLDTYEYTDNTATYKQGLDTNKSSTQLIQLNYKHVLDKYQRIEYIDNTINIRTNTINLHWDWSNRYYMT